MNHHTFPSHLIAFTAVLLVTATFLLTACDAVFVGACFNPYPAPKLDSVTPSTIDRQSLPVTMTINGSNFQTFSKARWNSSSLPTTFVDSHHLSVAVTPELLNSLAVTSDTNSISVITNPQTTANTLNCSSGGTSSGFVIVIIN